MIITEINYCVAHLAIHITLHMFIICSHWQKTIQHYNRSEDGLLEYMSKCFLSYGSIISLQINFNYNMKGCQLKDK